MRSKTLAALILLNAVLLASLLFHNVFTPAANAQVRIGKPSEYIMAPGEVQGASGGVIFIVDTRNNLLSVRNYANNRLEDMPPVDLGQIFKRAARP